MTYDLNGNLATQTDGGATRTYTWNPRNQLTGLSGPGLSASFGYDALGRRWTKTVNAAQTDVLYDGLNPVQEGVLPTTPSANLLTGLGLDEFFTRTDAAGLRAFLSDALGSTVALADAAGTVQTAVHLRAVRRDHGHRRRQQQPLSVHRPRERRHRPLLLPGAVLPSGARALCQRGSYSI